jgi:hypothetical protein
MITADPLLSEHSCLEVQISSVKLKRYKSQKLTKFRKNLSMQDVVHYVLGAINSLMLFRIRKNCHSS